MNIKHIKDAYSALDCLNNKSYTQHREALFELCREEEKSHRGFAPDFVKYHPGALSVSEAARLFAVKRIAEYMTGAKEPSGSDFLHIQHSCFYASALVCKFRSDIAIAWAALDIKSLSALSYTDFVKVAA